MSTLDKNTVEKVKLYRRKPELVKVHTLGDQITMFTLTGDQIFCKGSVQQTLVQDFEEVSIYEVVRDAAGNVIKRDPDGYVVTEKT